MLNYHKFFRMQPCLFLVLSTLPKSQSLMEMLLLAVTFLGHIDFFLILTVCVAWIHGYKISGYRDDCPVSNEHTNRCPTLLAIRKMRIENQLDAVTLSEVKNKKIMATLKPGKYSEKLDHSYITGQNESCTSLWILKKLNMQLAYSLSLYTIP